MIFLNMTGVMRRVDPEQAALYERYAAECVTTSLRITTSRR